MPGCIVGGGGGDPPASSSNGKGQQRNGEIVSGLSHRLFRREGPFPALHYPLGGDVFISPFLGMVSIRKYVCYRSPMMYPTGYGRTFALDQWKTLIKYMKSITDAVLRHAPDEVRFDLTDQGCCLVVVKSNLVDGDPPLDRGVVFVQEGRENFVLSPAQWQQLIKRARCYLLPGILATQREPPPPPPPPPPSTSTKRQQSSTGSTTTRKKRMTKKQQLDEQQQRLLLADVTGGGGAEETTNKSAAPEPTSSLVENTTPPWEGDENDDSRYWLTSVNTPDSVEELLVSPPPSPSTT